jgi:hypothetical protein
MKFTEPQLTHLGYNIGERVKTEEIRARMYVGGYWSVAGGVKLYPGIKVVVAKTEEILAYIIHFGKEIREY